MLEPAFVHLMHVMDCMFHWHEMLLHAGLFRAYANMQFIALIALLLVAGLRRRAQEVYGKCQHYQVQFDCIGQGRPIT